jgi:RNA polymerase sigma-32 factor
MTSFSAELSYLSTVASRSPPLAREQETELARCFRDSGDRSAADRLVRAQLRMVIVMALKFRYSGIPIVDLVAEGNCGLVTALSRFDPERAIRFGTYARHWVRAHMLACVAGSLNVVGGKTGLVRPQLFFKLRRERARIAALLGDEPAAEQALAERMDLSLEQLQRLLGSLDVRRVSLDGRDGDPREEWLDTLASADDPEDHYFSDKRREAAASAVSIALRVLDARERFIAERRLMAAPTEQLSLAELARTMGISRERARQLEERAKDKLGRSAAIRRNSKLLEWFVD